MSDSLNGSHRELASKSKLKKGKTVKYSVTGLGKSTLTTMAVPHVQKTSLCEISGNVNKKQSTDDQTVHISAVPVLQSLPPTGPCTISVTTSAELAIDTTNIHLQSWANNFVKGLEMSKNLGTNFL